MACRKIKVVPEPSSFLRWHLLSQLTTFRYRHLARTPEHASLKTLFRDAGMTMHIETDFASAIELRVVFRRNPVFVPFRDRAALLRPETNVCPWYRFLDMTKPLLPRNQRRVTQEECGYLTLLIVGPVSKQRLIDTRWQVEHRATFRERSRILVGLDRAPIHREHVIETCRISSSLPSFVGFVAQVYGSWNSPLSELRQEELMASRAPVVTPHQIWLERGYLIGCCRRRP